MGEPADSQQWLPWLPWPPPAVCSTLSQAGPCTTGHLWAVPWNAALLAFHFVCYVVAGAVVCGCVSRPAHCQVCPSCKHSPKTAEWLARGLDAWLCDPVPWLAGCVYALRSRPCRHVTSSWFPLGSVVGLTYRQMCWRCTHWQALLLAAYTPHLQQRWLRKKGSWNS
jgi:hypothetical protein